ncbi:MAG: hypothetical protein ACLPIC_12665 [Rhodoblastus sp.]|uniref:hypothetical protein n=1 Tax=Rhodoblastus sp. TaxID=1962975 RepID=UPI003F9E4418
MNIGHILGMLDMSRRLILAMLIHRGELPLDLFVVEIGMKNALRRRWNGITRGERNEIGSGGNASQPLEQLAVAGCEAFDAIRLLSAKRHNDGADNRALLE